MYTVRSTSHCRYKAEMILGISFVLLDCKDDGSGFDCMSGNQLFHNSENKIGSVEFYHLTRSLPYAGYSLKFKKKIYHFKISSTH